MTFTSTDWSQFRYCPKCGSGAITCQGKKMTCQACSFVFYFNPALSVAALITDEQNRLLVTLRAHDPGKGTWDLPGGFADPGESAEGALARELQEELGVSPLSLAYIMTVPNTYLYRGITYHTIDVIFRVQIDRSQSLQTADDVAAFEFVARSDLEVTKFGMDSMQRVIAHFLANEKI